MRRRNTQRGVTLSELLVALAIATLVTTLAVPSMRAFVAAQQVRAAAEDLSYAMLLARSEAVKRAGTTVSLEAVDSDWTNGWTVDADEIGTLLAGGPFRGVSVDGPESPLTWDFTGRPDNAASFTLENVEHPDAARCVDAGPTGLPRVRKGACN